MALPLHKNLRMKIGLAALLATISSMVCAQNTITVINELPSVESFTYRMIRQEYITNENNYFLEVYADTNYLKFDKVKKNIFDMKIYKDGACKVRYNGVDSTKKMSYRWRFNDSGKIVSIENSADFVRLLMVEESRNLEARRINFDQFNKVKEFYKDPMVVANIINADFVNLFGIAGDTFNPNNSYLRIRSIMSPIDQSLMPVMGTQTLEILNSNAQLYAVHAQNRIEGEQKQAFKQQLIIYMSKLEDKNFDKRTEVTNVGLNAEQDWVYNHKKHYMTKISLSDVFVVNLQSRGNIRIFEIWDSGKR